MIVKTAVALVVGAFALVDGQGTVQTFAKAEIWREECAAEFKKFLDPADQYLLPCGTEAFPCGVVSGMKAVGDDTPAIPCGTKVQIKSGGLKVVSDTLVHGIVAGAAKNEDQIPAGSWGASAAVLKALCRFPCPDDATNPAKWTCPDKPTDCPAGFVTRYHFGDHHVLSGMAFFVGELDLHYKFENDELPQSGDPATGTPAVLPYLADMVEIVEGEKYDCKAEVVTPYSEAEAITPDGCGTGDVPCPASHITDDLLGVCFDPATEKCVDLTFWIDGLTEISTNATMCKDKKCAPIGETVSRRFKLTMKDVTGTDERPTVAMPIGVWKDFCPVVCTSSEYPDSGFNSRTCAREAGDCVSSFPEEGPTTPVTDWQPYTVPVARPEVQLMSISAIVDCKDPTPAPTAAPTDVPTTPTSTTTTTTKKNAAYSRQGGVVGGLTALLLACGVVYNM